MESERVTKPGDAISDSASFVSPSNAMALENDGSGDSLPPVGQTTVGGDAGSRQESGGAAAAVADAGGTESSSTPVPVPPTTAGVINQEIVDKDRPWLKYCTVDTFIEAVEAYLASCVNPPQWNEWQKIVHKLAGVYEDQLPEGPVAPAFFSTLYNNSMKKRYGPLWRTMRRELPAASVFAGRKTVPSPDRVEAARE